MASKPTKKPAPESSMADWRVANSARATYGLILLMSVLAVWGNEDHPNPTEVLVSVVATSLIFWIAHVYSEVIALRIREGRETTAQERRAILGRELPLIEVAIPPMVLLALSIAGAMSAFRAIDISIWLCLAGLGALGWFSAKSAGATGSKLVLITGFSLALGIAIVVLKTLIH